MTDSKRAPSRREEYAEATWQAVVAAARELFAESGYSKTTVQQIARRARVSPATVYAQCGGKQGLLKTLTDSYTAGPLIQETIDACKAVPDGAEKLQILADSYVTIFEASADLMGIVTDAAAASEGAAEFLEVADGRHLAVLIEIVTQIRKAGDLKEGLTTKEAARIIFWHFRFEQLSLAAIDYGWGIERACAWIHERVADAILA